MSESSNADLVKVDAIKVRGVLYDVFYNRGASSIDHLEAHLGGDLVVSGANKRELENKASAALKAGSVRVDIPFVAFRNGVLVKGTVTGRHATNGRVLVRWGSGEAEQIENHKAMGFLQPIGPADQELYHEAVKRRADAAAAVKRLDDQFHLDVASALDAAYKAALVPDSEGPKTRFVPASEIAADPNMSLRAEDYVNKP